MPPLSLKYIRVIFEIAILVRPRRFIDRSGHTSHPDQYLVSVWAMGIGVSDGRRNLTVVVGKKSVNLSRFVRGDTMAM